MAAATELNLINVHTLDKYKNLIYEVDLTILGQGLVGYYDILLRGREHNKYIFVLLDEDGQEHRFYFNEMMITDWRIKSISEAPDNPYNDYNLHLRIFGNLDKKKFLWCFSGDCDDFDHVEIERNMYKVIDIIVTNEHPEILGSDVFKDDYDAVLCQKRYKYIEGKKYLDEYTFDSSDTSSSDTSESIGDKY